MFVLTAYNPETNEKEIIYLSKDRSNLEYLIKEFEEQVNLNSFEESPEQIKFGYVVLTKNKCYYGTYSFGEMYLFYNTKFSIKEPPIFEDG